jgi:hypothetical protein
MAGWTEGADLNLPISPLPSSLFPLPLSLFPIMASREGGIFGKNDTTRKSSQGSH